jgi:hypothetical protein
MSLYTPQNDVVQLQLSNAYTAGRSNTFTVASGGSQLGSAFPIRITVIQQSTYGQGASEVSTIYGVTGVSGNTISISGPLEGTVDRNFTIGDYLEARITAGYITDLNAAVGTLQTTTLTRSNNLSDVASASAARGNLGAGAASRVFGVAGAPTASATTPPILLNRGYASSGVEAACGTTPSGGPATLTLQTSPDGVNWSTLVAISIAAGSYMGTAPVTTAISPGTLVRGLWSAVNGVVNMTATLYLVG